ncbi:MAG: T9SS type A sorting domain-containing protein [Ferruginibacter sp.]
MKSILIIIICLVQTVCFAAGINPNLTAEYNVGRKQVALKWQNIDVGVTRFILQRSDDNISWKNVFVLESEDFREKKQEKFYDRSPEPNTNYYRLQIFTGKNIEYSATIMVVIGSPANSWIMYPVPVRDVLNLQYNGSEAIKGVVSIFIQNMYGHILVRKRYSSLNRTIQVPVDNLGRGTYDIRIVINDEIVWNQRFIK